MYINILLCYIEMINGHYFETLFSIFLFGVGYKMALGNREKYNLLQKTKPLSCCRMELLVHITLIFIVIMMTLKIEIYTLVVIACYS